MDTQTYIVLWDLGKVQPAADPFAHPVMRGGEVKGLESAGSNEFDVQVKALDRQEHRELRSDPRAIVARPVPIQLVKPVAEPLLAVEPPHIEGAAWGVGAVGALKSKFVGRGVTVAVLDTGIDAAHPAFGGVELIQQDFTGEGNGDAHGHGTHVAGTIFGQAVDGTRIGVAPGVQKALIGKVLGQQGGGSTQSIIEAIQWAVKGGAQIINMSLGIDFPGLVQELVSKQGMPVDLATSVALADYRDTVRLFDKLVGLIEANAQIAEGALLVAAAGNESRRDVNPNYEITVSPPASADGMVAVAAVQMQGDDPKKKFKIAPFSNIRAAVAAPGVGIYSAKMGGGYRYLSGTSMASPHVAGVAALWAEKQLKENGTINLRALSSQLLGRASKTRLDKSVDNLDAGAGLVVAP